MTVGEKIKRIRKLRGMTQRELGLAVEFPERSADVRIAQYESGSRTPKAEQLRAIADALRVDSRIFVDADFCTPAGILNLLFWMEEEIPIRLHEAEDDGAAHVAVSFQMERLDALLADWKGRRERFLSGEISAEEYGKWKFCRAENDRTLDKTTPPE